MEQYLKGFKYILEKIDSYRDRFLAKLIIPYWPRKITPNHVTWIRVCIGILLLILIFFFDIQDKVLIVTLFSIGAISDLIDGPIARTLDKVTEFGAILDSTADRILIIPIAIYSLLKYYRWLLLLLFFIEIMYGIIALFYKSKEIYIESNVFGKLRMALYCLAFIIILIVWPRHPPTIFFDILLLTIPFSLLSLLVMITEIYSFPHET